MNWMGGTTRRARLNRESDHFRQKKHFAASDTAISTNFPHPIDIDEDSSHIESVVDILKDVEMTMFPRIQGVDDALLSDSTHHISEVSPSGGAIGDNAVETITQLHSNSSMESANTIRDSHRGHKENDVFLVNNDAHRSKHKHTHDNSVYLSSKPPPTRKATPKEIRRTASHNLAPVPQSPASVANTRSVADSLSVIQPTASVDVLPSHTRPSSHPPHTSSINGDSGDVFGFNKKVLQQPLFYNTSSALFSSRGFHTAPNATKHLPPTLSTHSHEESAFSHLQNPYNKVPKSVNHARSAANDAETLHGSLPFQEVSDHDDDLFEPIDDTGVRANKPSPNTNDAYTHMHSHLRPLAQASAHRLPHEKQHDREQTKSYCTYTHTSHEGHFRAHRPIDRTGNANGASTSRRRDTPSHGSRPRRAPVSLDILMLQRAAHAARESLEDADDSDNGGLDLGPAGMDGLTASTHMLAKPKSNATHKQEGGARDATSSRSAGFMGAGSSVSMPRPVATAAARAASLSAHQDVSKHAQGPSASSHALKASGLKSGMGIIIGSPPKGVHTQGSAAEAIISQNHATTVTSRGFPPGLFHSDTLSARVAEHPAELSHASFSRRTFDTYSTAAPPFPSPGETFGPYTAPAGHIGEREQLYVPASHDPMQQVGDSGYYHHEYAPGSAEYAFTQGRLSRDTHGGAKPEFSAFSAAPQGYTAGDSSTNFFGYDFNATNGAVYRDHQADQYPYSHVRAHDVRAEGNYAYPQSYTDTHEATQPAMPFTETGSTFIGGEHAPYQRVHQFGQTLHPAANDAYVVDTHMGEAGAYGYVRENEGYYRAPHPHSRHYPSSAAYVDTGVSSYPAQQSYFPPHMHNAYHQGPHAGPPAYTYGSSAPEAYPLPIAQPHYHTQGFHTYDLASSPKPPLVSPPQQSVFSTTHHAYTVDPLPPRTPAPAFVQPSATVSEGPYLQRPPPLVSEFGSDAAPNRAPFPPETPAFRVANQRDELLDAQVKLEATPRFQPGFFANGTPKQSTSTIGSEDELSIFGAVCDLTNDSPPVGDPYKMYSNDSGVGEHAATSELPPRTPTFKVRDPSREWRRTADGVRDENAGDGRIRVKESPGRVHDAHLFSHTPFSEMNFAETRKRSVPIASPTSASRHKAAKVQKLDRATSHASKKAQPIGARATPSRVNLAHISVGSFSHTSQRRIPGSPHADIPIVPIQTLPDSQAPLPDILMMMQRRSPLHKPANERKIDVEPVENGRAALVTSSAYVEVRDANSTRSRVRDGSTSRGNVSPPPVAQNTGEAEMRPCDKNCPSASHIYSDIEQSTFTADPSTLPSKSNVVRRHSTTDFTKYRSVSDLHLLPPSSCHAAESPGEQVESPHLMMNMFKTPLIPDFATTMFETELLPVGRTTDKEEPIAPHVVHREGQVHSVSLGGVRIELISEDDQLQKVSQTTETLPATQVLCDDVRVSEQAKTNPISTSGVVLVDRITTGAFSAQTSSPTTVSDQWFENTQ